VKRSGSIEEESFLSLVDGIPRLRLGMAGLDRRSAVRGD
jgi:hypothetical protein